LLVTIPLPDHTDASALVKALLQQYLYLPYISSSIMIVFIWMQLIAAHLFLIWPVSTIQAGLLFLLTVAEVTTFRMAGSIPAWLVGTGVIAVIGGVIYLNNLLLRTQDDMQERGAATAEIRSNLLSGAGYLAIGLAVTALGFAQSHFMQTATGWVALSGDALRWGELSVLLVLLCGLLYLDSAHRQDMLRQVAKDSDLVVLPHGKIRYRNPGS
jgi:hypothetical protein